MELFKRIFNRARIIIDKFSNGNQINGSDKGQEKVTVDQQSITAKSIKDSIIIQVIDKHHDAVPLVDEKIDEHIEIIRKSRFFFEFDTSQACLTLVRKMVDGDLSGGSDRVRSRGIAWCSRFLSSTNLEKAEECLAVAKQLDNCPEITIAEAFIFSQRNNKEIALSILAKLSMPLVRSASLMIIANREGAQAAVEWLKNVGASVSELDSDGKYFLLTLHFNLKQWDAAKLCLDFITDADLDSTPALNQLVAMTYLTSAVPNELRTIVLSQVPFDAAHFPLSSDTAAIEAIKKAGGFFFNAVEIAQRLTCFTSAKTFEEFALWLGLKDLSQHEQTREKLKEKLRDLKSALHLVRLGLQFGIELDLMLVEKEIERKITLHGGITYDAAVARFSVAFTKKKPEDVANYIVRHFEELIKHFDKKSLQFLQIELYSQADMPERAKECLDILLQEGLSEEEEKRLQRIIAAIEGNNPVDICMERFKKTGSFDDLMLLVEELEVRKEWDELCGYAEIMFTRTRSLRDAERLATVLDQTQKYERLVKFLKENIEILAQSQTLRMHYCWALYNEGALLEARTELSKLTDDNPNYRTLQVNLGIASGDWNSLNAFVNKEYIEKEKRTAQELISAAQLAQYLGSPYAKELTFIAAEKGNEDSGILIAAYHMASSGGWESAVGVSEWINKASELSSDNGPIQIKSLQDIIDMKPDWDRRESETLQLLSCGEIPMFIAGKSLNRSLIHMILFSAFANLSEKDLRRRVIIPAYSGIRQSTQLKSLRIVGMDPTVLLTLSLLKILDRVLEAFETVYIPHSTFKWLFEEKQKASFHQPSRIKDAKKLQSLLAKGILERLISNTVPNGNLSAQVGEELAQLIAEARRADDGTTQCIVVRPSPVYRISSLMMEEADLTEYATMLSSCHAIVNKLRSNGQITIEEEKRACAYLQISEKSWSNQPEIADRAILYLDNLAITYFLHLGLLEKLKVAGFRLIISPRELSQANELTSYEEVSEQVNDTIEQIRFAVSSRLELGKIKIGRSHNITEFDEGHPSIEIIALAKECEAIFVDDRFMNQHGNANEESPLFSTLDLLDMIAFNNSISDIDLLEYRTILRRAGYCFMPISDNELMHHLKASALKDSRVIETAELKAIRENILLVRMSNWLQLPKEASWLDELTKTFIRVLRGMWTNESDFSSNRVRSNWILSQLDVCGWAHCFGDEAGEDIIRTLRIEYTILLLFPLAEASRENKAEYWKWIEEMVLAPIKEEYPDLYFVITERCREKIARLVEMDLPNKKPMTKFPRAIIAQATLGLLPPLIIETLVEDAAFREDYGLTSDAIISFVDFGVYIQRSELYNAVRKHLSGISKVELLDKHDQKWELKNMDEERDVPRLELSSDKQCIVLPNFAELSPDSTIRFRYLDEVVSSVNLPSSTRDEWRNVFSKRSLSDDEVDAFWSDYRDTPIEQAKCIRSEIKKGQINLSSMVPPSRRYFERLIGIFDGSDSISDYAAGSGRTFFEQLSSWRPYDGFLFSLLLSSHFSLTAEINVHQLGKEEIVHAFEFLDKHGDIISQFGAVEVGLRVLVLRPEIEPILFRLITRLCDEAINAQDSGFKLISALFIVVDGELSRLRLFIEEPSFYRRLAAFSQAALIYRQVVNSGIDTGKFCEWAIANRGEQYYLQSFADMRMEPCRNPDFASALQIKANIFGRIMTTARNYEQNIKNRELYDLIFDTNSGSIYSLCRFPYSFYPGPLDGVDDTLKILPTEISKEINIQLSEQEVTAKSFIALLNSVMVFRVETEQAKLAAKALKRGGYRLSNVENQSQLLNILYGLATVAAITRNSELADELRIILRIYRRDLQYALSAEEVMSICLVAAASRKGVKEWRKIIGEWLTELAFGDLKGDDSEVLLSYLKCLCHAVPELLVSCGRAEAALMAYNARNC